MQRSNEMLSTEILRDYCYYFNNDFYFAVVPQKD